MNKKSTIMLLIIMDLVAAILLSVSLLSKNGLPYLFMVSVFIISILTIIFILKYNNTNIIYWHLFFLYILRSSVYFFSTEFSVLPFGDPYWDLGVTKAFIQTGKAEVIYNMTNWPSSNLTWMSGWPLLHVLSEIVVSITRLSVMNYAIFITYFFICMFFVFAYLLISFVSSKFAGKIAFGPIAILIFATSPESLFWNMQFKYQTIAMLLMLMVYYVIIKTFNATNRSIELTIIMLITLFATVMGHHLTSIAILLYLISGLIVFKVLEYVIPDFNLKMKVYKNIVIATIVFWFLWCTQYANFVWGSIGSVCKRFITFFNGMYSFEKAVVLASYPDILKPGWGIVLLIIRDIVMYIPALIGYVLIIKELPKRNVFNYFIAFSLTIYGLMLIINVTVIHIEPLRIITYALPFLAIASALFYSNILKHKIIIGFFVVIVTFVGYVGQWSHNYIPLHLWSDLTIGNVVGEHNIQYRSIDNFVNQNFGDYELIYADDFSLLYPLLDPESYYKIRALRKNSNIDNNTKSIVVSFRNFGLYNYSGAMATSNYNEKNNTYQESLDLSNKVRENVNGKMSSVFDSGSIEIYVAQGG